MNDIIIIVFSYLLGSILFGVLIARVANLGNLRDIGSHNVGATNVMRIGGKKLGILTAILDGAKGYVAVLIAQYYDTSIYLASFVVVLGHIFPIWCKFRGGKGVATTLGVLFCLKFLLGAIFSLIWILVFAFTRVSSVSSLISIILIALISYAFGFHTALTVTAIALLVVYKHKENIKRLIGKTEHQIKI